MRKICLRARTIDAISTLAYHSSDDNKGNKILASKAQISNKVQQAKMYCESNQNLNPTPKHDSQDTLGNDLRCVIIISQDGLKDKKNARLRALKTGIKNLLVLRIQLLI